MGSVPEIGHEIVGGVYEREGPVRDLLTEKVTQWCPSMTDVVLEEAVARNDLADEVVVLSVDVLPLVLEIALEEAVPEKEQHGTI